MKPETINPETKFPANNMIIALMINKNKPNEIIVAGSVNKISNGLTNIFKMAITKATQIAVEKLSTEIPGKTFAKTTTTSAVNKSFNMKFICSFLNYKYFNAKTLPKQLY
jgi:hypothetical protein